MPVSVVKDPQTGRDVEVPWDGDGTPSAAAINAALDADRAKSKSPVKSLLSVLTGMSDEIESARRIAPTGGGELAALRIFALRPAARAFGAVSHAARSVVDAPVGGVVKAMARRSESNLSKLDPATAARVHAGNLRLLAAGERLASRQSTLGQEAGLAIESFITGREPGQLGAGDTPGARPTARAASTLVSLGGDLVTDPTNLAPLGGLSKFGRLGSQLQYMLSAAMAGAGGEGALQEAGNVLTALREGRLDSTQAVESAIRGLASAGFTALGAHGFAKGFSRDRVLGRVERLQQEADLLRAAGIEATAPEMIPHLETIAPAVRQHVRQRTVFREQQHELNAQKAERLRNAFREMAVDPASTAKVFGALRGENDGIDLNVPNVSRESQLALWGHVAEAANTGRVSEWTAVHALEGLERLLGRGSDSASPLAGERVNAAPLELSERAALRAVFGRHFYDTEFNAYQESLPARSALQKTGDVLTDALFDATRAIQASSDLSAVLRQGGPITVYNFLRHPLRTGTDIAKSVSAFGSREAYRTLERDLHNMQYDYTPADGKPETVHVTRLAEQSGLQLASRSGDPLSGKLNLEEYFQSSLAERIPVVGEIVKGSERAYSAYLDQIRLRTFREWDEFFRDAGEHHKTNPKLWKDAAEAINALTGNSPLPKLQFGRGRELDLNRAGPILRLALFAPKFFYSRLKLLKDTLSAGRGYEPLVRRQAAKVMGSYIGAYTALLAGLSQLVPGVTVETDPRSSDFVKIKVGNTRFDVWAGLQQPTRFAAQMLAGQKKSGSTGKIEDVVGSPGWWARRAAHYLTTGELPPSTRGVFSDPALGMLATFAESKASPAFNWMADAMRGGVDLFGKPAPLSPTERFRPFVTRDVREAAKTNPTLAALAVAPAALLGVGTQVYADKPEGEAARAEAKQLRPERKRSTGDRLASGLRRDERAKWEVKIRKAMRDGDDDKVTDLLISASDAGYNFPQIRRELLGEEPEEE